MLYALLQTLSMVLTLVWWVFLIMIVMSWLISELMSRPEPTPGEERVAMLNPFATTRETLDQLYTVSTIRSIDCERIRLSDAPAVLAGDPVHGRFPAFPRRVSGESTHW